jgi:hypothetical protein
MKPWPDPTWTRQLDLRLLEEVRTFHIRSDQQHYNRDLWSNEFTIPFWRTVTLSTGISSSTRWWGQFGNYTHSSIVSLRSILGGSSYQLQLVNLSFHLPYLSQRINLAYKDIVPSIGASIPSWCSTRPDKGFPLSRFTCHRILVQFVCSSGLHDGYVRIEVFTELTMTNDVFRDVTPCGSCKNWCFGGTQCHLHQGDKNQWTRNNASYK